jgi:uncharacterized membrane protein YfcA
VDDVATWTTVLTLVLGFGSGLLAGMFGIGGAVITTPTIRVLGATPIEAVGSTVPAILPGSISGAYRYWREGLVEWRVGLGCGLTGAVFAVAGAKLDDLVEGHYLMVLTALLLAFSGVSIIRTADAPAAEPLPPTGPEGDQAEAIGRPSGRSDLATSADPTDPAAPAGLANPDTSADPADPADPMASTTSTTSTDRGGPTELVDPSGPADRGEPPPVAATATPDAHTWTGSPNMAVLCVVGAAAGLLAGVLGVGGGIVMMPAFTGVLKMPIKLAVGSSLVAVALFSIPAVIAHTVLGHIAWRFALPLMIGVVPGTQVGALISVASSDRTMRLLFGTFILVLSVVYGGAELLALR